MGKKTKEVTTNAIRIVRTANIPITVHTYDSSKGFQDGVSVARSTGMNPDQVFKTLVLVSNRKEYHVACIPVAKELDLKKVAKAFGEKNVEMIPVKDLTKVTGYIKGGCSPVGMKKQFTTAIDYSAQDFETIVVSGGKIGVQMELSPQDLSRLVHAQFVDLTKE